MTVYPLILDIGPLTVTGYGLMMALGFLMGGWVIQNELLARNMKDTYAADIVVAGVIGGIVGAKLWYVALYRDPGALLSRGGLVWYGGFFGAVAAILLGGYLRNIPGRFTAEITVAGGSLGYAIGRIGCFLVQDDYGVPTAVPWGMRFPEGLPASTAINLQQQFGVTVPSGTGPTDILAVHPTQLYEVAAMMFVFWLLWRLRHHQHAIGWRFALYLVLAGTERFGVEFFRAKDDRFLGMFTLAQATSFAVFLCGIALLSMWWRKDDLAIPSKATILSAAHAKT